MKNILFLLFLLLLGGQMAAQNPCPLPPPASITFYDVGPDQAKADWPLVSGANMYQVELINVNTNTTVSVNYYSLPGASFTSLTNSTVYEARISSSACVSTNPADFGEPISGKFQTTSIIIGDIVYGFNQLSRPPAPETADHIWACIPWIDPANPTAEQILHIRVNWGETDYREFELVCQIVNSVPKLRIAEYNPASGDPYVVSPINGGSQAKIIYSGIDRILIDAPIFTSANTPARVSILILDETTDLIIDPLCTSVNILYDGSHYCPTTQRGVSGERDLDQAAPALSFTAAPNPFSDLLTLRMQPETDGPVDLLLLNALGQVVRSRHFDAVKASEQLEIDLETSDLAPGMYLLSVQTRAGRQTQTLIKH